MPVASASNTYFKDDVLNVPGYRFGKASPWRDTGSATLLAEGVNLKDGSRVLAKIASAHSNGSLCLERELHVHSRMAALPEAANTTIKLLETLTLPPHAGDCVVLILMHPGYNALSRFFPAEKMNDLLLAGTSPRPPNDDSMLLDTPPVGESKQLADSESWDAMDIASFLEFAIEAARCLEVMHKAGLVHREVRANAFHLSSFSGVVRLVHFGNRSQSLEQLGGPSALVLKSATDAMDEVEKQRVKEALCYLAPEQTGSVETIYEDHRTDLYSLGIVFWMLLVGHIPFDGGPMELLHSIVQKRPLIVHEARRDVPLVVALIIDKLLSKSADKRYNSAFGLKADLLECQKRLNLSCATPDLSLELIPIFDIAQQDKFMDFIIPSGLFGREAEIEQIGAVIRQASTSHSRYLAASRPTGASSSSAQDDISHSGSGKSPDIGRQDTPMSPESLGVGVADYTSSSTTPSHERSLRHDRRDGPKVRAVVVYGPAGIGKSSLISWYQANWRRHGLWGHAKFQDDDSTPFAGILACLSSVLRQLMAFQSDLHRFTSILQTRLGPQVHNLPLLFHGAPELRDVLTLFDINVAGIDGQLSTEELRVRFQSLVVNVFCVLSEVRMLALFLDDLHVADQSSVDLITSLAGSRSNILILASFRSETQTAMTRINSIFASTPQTVWIPLHPLTQDALSALVSRTLHRNDEDVAALTGFLHRISRGNAFSARNMLITLQRAGYIKFSWEHNYWHYDIAAIENSFVAREWVSNPGDVSFLLAHIQDLPDEARKYLLWASMFGTVFKVQEIAFVMDREDADHDPDIDGPWGPAPAVPPSIRSGKPSVRGLHLATSEGWLVQRARDMCSWTHDRYRQAALESLAMLPPSTLEKMSLRIVLMLMQESEPDTYRIAEHCRRCLTLVSAHPRRDDALRYLLDAAFAASTRGALEVALQSFCSAKVLLGENAWEVDHAKTFGIYLKIAELLTWKGDVDASDEMLKQILGHIVEHEDQAKVWRAFSRNSFFRKDFDSAVKNIVIALRILGVELNPAVTMRETDEMFESCKGKILAAGNEQILSAPRCTDPKVDLSVALLNDAGTAAYWAGAPAFMTSVGLTIIELAFRSGLCPGTALGFFWILGAAAEDRELFRFSVDIARLGLRIAANHGSSFEKSRAETYYCAMVSGFDNVHLRANIGRCEMAFKLAEAAGDRIYAGFARIYQICTHIYVCDDLSEVLAVTEDVMKDGAMWGEGSDVSTLAKGLAACVRALAGQTEATSAATVMDTPFWKEREYFEQLHSYGGNVALILNWYNSFKMAVLFGLGFFEEAAALGYEVFHARHLHPNHRHSRYALFWHSLALIQCCRMPRTNDKQREAYLEQVELNQSYIRKWVSPSPVNTGTWVAIVDAEVAALSESADAYRLYDVAVRLAINNDWLMEEGWALFLQGSHFVRNGVEGLGRELQRRAISRQAQWNANGVVNFMSSTLRADLHAPLKKNIFSVEIGVQTEVEEEEEAALHRSTIVPTYPTFEQTTDSVAELDADDLRAILKWSQIISSDVNLSVCLQRLTEIAADSCKAQFASVVMRTDEGDYSVATSMVAPQPCTVYENMTSVRSIPDPLRRAVIQHTLNVQEPLFIPDVSQEPRFASEALRSSAHSILCVPMMSNRGQTFGVIFLSSRIAFTLHDSRLLGLLVSQAGISISNALLFRSLQQATKANLKMISTQKSALEETRKSREDALKATKIKSNFLASMSHELRTPFSSFYGLLDILGETPLDASQREIVATAKQSCELLLKIIDSILDYSKLEASALKLEISPFAVEDMIADCMELLLPLAAQKLEMAYNVDPGVPRWISADYARIRQVLMNLLGNALKFTEKGTVTVTLSIDTEMSATRPDVLFLKCVVEDTGIGLTDPQMDVLFQPFQQADNSSTRRFGGTGLGLSISMQLCKLMGGDIGVSSNAGVGSTFFFRIPVTVAETPASIKAGAELASLRSKLAHPTQVRVLLCSPSQATLALLESMLSGLFVAKTASVEEAEAWIRNPSIVALDFAIVDHPDELRVQDLLRILQASPAHSKAKIIHLFTPTASAARSQHIRWSPTPEPPPQTSPGTAQISLGNIVRLSKPPRTMRLLVILASLKDMLPDMSLMPISEVHAPVEDPNGLQRTLYGNVLIAEDNDVARQLLVKQLTRYKLTVTATSNGKEAVTAWQAHEPGYFSVALFDHHMPVMDGVEATKQVRLLEARNKVPVQLPIVALSADCQESTKALCLSAGMNGFLAKPLKRNDLTSLLSMFWTLVQPAAG
ncbi:STKc type histidine kinase [Exidia glandulosa HHB12029]|uniref:STKc type histidine kinase n=1 Tax=Exidia glandulosa HHB12029 TaxID=1314781 RepID=A0A165K0L1_EXIGL|nr:STKc type histidine kinase [Exidia glandulosa HHB12029]